MKLLTGLVRWGVRYLVTARVLPGKEEELLRAVEKGTLGLGSVAGEGRLGLLGEDVLEARDLGDL